MASPARGFSNGCLASCCVMFCLLVAPPTISRMLQFDPCCCGEDASAGLVRTMCDGIRL